MGFIMSSLCRQCVERAPVLPGTCCVILKGYNNYQTMTIRSNRPDHFNHNAWVIHIQTKEDEAGSFVRTDFKVLVSITDGSPWFSPAGVPRVITSTWAGCIVLGFVYLQLGRVVVLCVYSITLSPPTGINSTAGVWLPARQRSANQDPYILWKSHYWLFSGVRWLVMKCDRNKGNYCEKPLYRSRLTANSGLSINPLNIHILSIISPYINWD